MFRAAALVPTPPLLVPELMGRSSSEVDDLRTAVRAAASVLGSSADRWLAVGVDSSPAVYGPDTVGTFRGFGVDLVVGLSDSALSEAAAPQRASSAGAGDPDLPLPVLIAGWLRAQVQFTGLEVRTIASDTGTDRCLQMGSDLRRELDEDDVSWGVLVLGDGANTLTEKAPGSFDDRAGEAQRSIDDALARADVAAIAALDVELCHQVGATGRAVWQLLAGLVGRDPIRAEELYRGAPFGVGYFVGNWSHHARA